VGFVRYHRKGGRVVITCRRNKASLPHKGKRRVFPKGDVGGRARRQEEINGCSGPASHEIGGAARPNRRKKSKVGKIQKGRTSDAEVGLSGKKSGGPD